MGVVDSITQLVVSAGNAAISAFTFKSQVAAAGVGAFRASTSNNTDKRVQIPTAPVNSSPNGVSTLPNDNSLTDPALLEAPKVLQLANTLQQLISGGQDGKPDWERIRSKDVVCRAHCLANYFYNSRTCSPVRVAQTSSSSLYDPPRKTWTKPRTYRQCLMYTLRRVSISSMPSLK